jgi:hypothetical protein
MGEFIQAICLVKIKIVDFVTSIFYINKNNTTICPKSTGLFQLLRFSPYLSLTSSANLEASKFFTFIDSLIGQFNK